jgi:hypothetical protein
MRTEMITVPWLIEQDGVETKWKLRCRLVHPRAATRDDPPEPGECEIEEARAGDRVLSGDDFIEECGVTERDLESIWLSADEASADAMVARMEARWEARAEARRGE